MGMEVTEMAAALGDLRTHGQTRLATRQGLSARSTRGRAVSDVEALTGSIGCWRRRSTARRLAGLAGAHANPELHARLDATARGSAVARPFPRARAAGARRAGAAERRRDARLAPGDVLAGYRLIRELGRGGMSVVWLAERADGVVKREVALKMPMFMLQGDGDVARFTRERDALAALSHPNVARLYDAGVLPSGQPFIVLEYVDGEPLLDYCDARQLDVRARLRLFLQVLARGRARAQAPGRAPRPQALEHPGGRRRPGEAARLRHRQTTGRSGPRGALTQRGRRHDAAVRRARAASRRDHLDAHRRVLARRGAARAADRSACRIRGARRAADAGRGARGIADAAARQLAIDDAAGVAPVSRRRGCGRWTAISTPSSARHCASRRTIVTRR